MASRSYTVPNRAARTAAQQPSKSPVKAGQSPVSIVKKPNLKRTKAESSVPSGRAPKRQMVKKSPNASEVIDVDKWVPASKQAPSGKLSTKSKGVKKEKGEEPQEKRLRKFRVRAPSSYTERLQRVLTQRMFLLDRNRTLSVDGTFEEEVFDIAGTTGNIYQVTITRNSTCTCPDAAKGNQCKHIIYVLVNVLKARSDLAYQLALLTSELAEIFAHAPSTPQSSSDEAPTSTDTGGSRKPIEGDCPICVMEFDVLDASESIVWCKGACGNNVHKHCFEQWARSKPGEVKCVYCRTKWKAEEPGDEIIKGIDKKGERNWEGYVNVGTVLGLSGKRDMSTYHPYWVRRQMGDGQW